MLDIEQALSSSLDRDGRGGMRADLFMSGNKITGLEPGTQPDDAATVGQIGGAVGIPIGTVLDYWGVTPPAGYLFAAGQEVSRATYADLFAAMGTVAGAGNGSTTFTLPDYRGRVGAGRDNMATPSAARLNTLSSSTLGASGGSQTHALTTAELAAHTHAVTDPGHAHNTSGESGFLENAQSGFVRFTPTSLSGAPTTSATTGITVASAGSGAAHNNVQPTIICNKIIKAL